MADKRLSDKIWRLENLYLIKNLAGEMIQFKLNRAQLDFHKNKHNRNIILKSRKLGFSTYEAIDALDDALFLQGTDALMRSYDETSQKDLFDIKIVFAWNNFPDELKELYELDANRANKLKFNWGDGTTSSVTVRLHGRGGNYTRLHLSEFAKICKMSPNDANEVITGDIPSVPINGRVDIESTPEGDYGDFYEMFMEAHNRGNPTLPVQYKAFFYNWQWDDAELNKINALDYTTLPKEFQEYKIKFALTDIEITYYYFRWLSVNKKWDRLRQQYPTTVEEAFMSGGEKYFNSESLESMKVRDPKEVVEFWKYYADYKVGHRYAIASDSSDGIKKDNSTIVVIDFDSKDGNGYCKPEVVATYVNDNIPPDLFAFEIRNAGVHFGNCIVAPERNYPGNATITVLKGLYYNIYTQIKTEKKTDIETENLGWHTNGSTKLTMMSDLSTAINEKLFNVPDIGLLRELKTYPAEDVTKVKDENGKHWDLCISLAICWQMQKHTTPSGKFIITDGSEEGFDKFSPIGSCY